MGIYYNQIKQRTTEESLNIEICTRVYRLEKKDVNRADFSTNDAFYKILIETILSNFT